MNPFDQWLPTYQPGAVAERPWWRCVDGHQVRVDGVTRSGNFGEPHGAYAREFLGPWFATRDEWIAHLDAYDNAHPLPVPPPMCGQVWAENHGGIVATYQIAATVEIDRETTAMIFVSTGGRVEMQKVEPWPSPNAVLVAGPFAPWAPKGWRP